MAARDIRRCFVIMPFGVKSYVDGKMDFDTVFDEYIAKAAKHAEYKAERADRTDDSGVITKRMMDLIWYSPVAVVDITTNNPNVFYELGVRHALHKRGTVLIRRKGSGNEEVSAFPKRNRFGGANEAMPFNIRGMTVFDYEMNTRGMVTTDPSFLAAKIIAAAAARDGTDSLPYEHIPNLRIEVKGTPVGRPRTRHYELTARPGTTVGYRSGDLKNVKGIDIWVNSENTMMQMARTNEFSISSTIRYHGAIDADHHSPERNDTIAHDLRRAMGNRRIVDGATVLETTSGKLATTNGVKAILHVASVEGKPGKGWTPLDTAELAACVENVILKARELSLREVEPIDARSLLIPLMGTGQSRGERDRICETLLQTAVSVLLEAPPVATGIKHVLFLAYSDMDVQMLDQVYDGMVRSGQIKETTKVGSAP